MFDLNSPETKFVIKAVRQAALLVAQVQGEMVTQALTKDDRSPVTVADFASQALVGSMLVDAFPQDSLVAEEDCSTLKSEPGQTTLGQVTHYVKSRVESADPDLVCKWIDHNRADGGQRFWTLDPIDGTKGFLRGDQYVVALALVVDGQVQLAGLGCPNLEKANTPRMGGEGTLLVAVRKNGAWCTGLKRQSGLQHLRVSGIKDPSQARIVRSFESGHTNVNQIDAFAQALGVQAAPRRMDSQAKYALLASGYAELYLRLLSPSLPYYQEKIWDQAAGSLILTEAGGRISDLDGKPLDFSLGRQLSANRGVLGSNGIVHQAALEALREVGV